MRLVLGHRATKLGPSNGTYQHRSQEGI